METLRNANELKDIPSTYRQIFQNTFTNSIDKSKIVTAKYNGALTDQDVAVSEFLFHFRFSTLEQIYKYLELKNLLDVDDTIELLKVRLDKLVKMYKVLNKFILAPYDNMPYLTDSLDFYCLDLGGLFLLYNPTDIPDADLLNWRPKNANIHTAKAVYRDIRIVDFYLRLLDIFGDTLVGFEPYKRMTYDKVQTIVSFDFCVRRDDESKYFIGEIITDEEIISRFAKSADSMEQIVSTNAWRKYYLDVDKPPVILYFVDDDDSALEIAQGLALRKIERFRITTVERVEGDLSTAFMIYDKDANELKLGKSKFFEK